MTVTFALREEEKEVEREDREKGVEGRGGRAGIE